MNAPATNALDEPVRAALDGPHAHLAVRHRAAVRYHPDVAPFLAPPRDAAEWDDATTLAGPGGVVVVRNVPRIRDVDAMLALVGRTEPGPFARRTHELGTYLGVRDDLVGLVAMAGERLRVPGATEISAVCTDPAARGSGLATRLVLAIAAGIRARGELPILHASADNTSAIRLYAQLGFTLRAEPSFVAVRAPEKEARS